MNLEVKSSYGRQGSPKKSVNKCDIIIREIHDIYSIANDNKGERVDVGTDPKECPVKNTSAGSLVNSFLSTS